jgi:hypothetical protein
MFEVILIMATAGVALVGSIVALFEIRVALERRRLGR